MRRATGAVVPLLAALAATPAHAGQAEAAAAVPVLATGDSMIQIVDV